MAELFTPFAAAEMAQIDVLTEKEGGKRLGMKAVEGIAVDSRKVKGNFLFVALKGEQTDGHLYLRDALAKGASAVLVNRSYTTTEDFRAFAAENEVSVLVHDDSLKGLQELAKSWIARTPSLLRIGVTGSNGKTTTKEMIAAILAELAPTVKNEGNLNSEIGLPLAVFGVEPRHRYGVFEMGVNHPGEMDQMVEVLSPDYGLITNVGTAHIGPLGSREGIAAEKGRLFAALPEDGMGFYPEGSEWEEYFKGLCRAPMVSFGPETTGGMEQLEDLGMEGWKISYEGTVLHLRLPGRHNLQNLMAAVRVARSLGVEPEQVKKGVEGLEAIDGRSQLIDGTVRILHDSYNANGDSMQALFGTLKKGVPGERLVLVLGSMKELGDYAEASHREIGESLVALAARGAFLFGDEMKFAFREAEERGFSGELRYTDDYGELEEMVRRFVKPGDTVVLKGSHSMGLERLVQVLRELKFEEARRP